MIPGNGPQDTSSSGEKKIYDLLKRGLPDDFTIIHSLPWIASAIKEIDPKCAPTGEIDFLIIHESLGILALEVKGGIYRIEDGSFIYVRTGRPINHLHQIRNNVHGLARWMGNDPSLRLRIGYGFVYPDSDFGKSVICPGLVDTTVEPAQSLIIDRTNTDLFRLATNIRNLMLYWKKTLGNAELGAKQKDHLVEFLCPKFDGTPTWGSRVEYDNSTWLRLTQEQTSVVHSAMTQSRIVVTGWPGTGKTLIAIEITRRMVAQGKRVLVLAYNTLLANLILAKKVDIDAL